MKLHRVALLTVLFLLVFQRLSLATGVERLMPIFGGVLFAYFSMIIISILIDCFSGYYLIKEMPKKLLGRIIIYNVLIGLVSGALVIISIITLFGPLIVLILFYTCRAYFSSRYLREYLDDKEKIVTIAISQQALHFVLFIVLSYLFIVYFDKTTPAF